MSFNYDTLIKPILDDLDKNYQDFKDELLNKASLEKYYNSDLITNTYIEMNKEVTYYLTNFHASKKILELDMRDGFLKYANGLLETPLDIKSTCWVKEWHDVDISNKTSINNSPGNHRGFFQIRLKSALNVQADYVHRLNSNNYHSNMIQQSPDDSTVIDLTTFDMLVIGLPDSKIFNDIDQFKIDTGYTGSMFFYDVGVVDNNKSQAALDFVSNTTDLNVVDCDVEKLPAHTVVDLNGFTGYLI